MIGCVLYAPTRGSGGSVRSGDRQDALGGRPFDNTLKRCRRSSNRCVGYWVKLVTNSARSCLCAVEFPFYDADAIPAPYARLCRNDLSSQSHTRNGLPSLDSRPDSWAMSIVVAVTRR